MSVLSYQKTITSIGLLDGETLQSNPLRSNINRPHYLRLIQVGFDSQIPNIYNYGGINTGLVHVSKDDGATWDVIQIPDGVYTIALINSAIQSSISTYWTDASDPGLFIRYNTATQMVYVEMDESKLAVASHIKIDFKPTGSSLYELLGFVTTTTFASTGATPDLFTASHYAKINWFGNTVSVRLKGFGNLCYSNGSPIEEICLVPLSSAKVTNEYLYPTAGIRMPWIRINSMDNIQKFSVELWGGTKHLLLLEGSINLSFEIRED